MIKVALIGCGRVGRKHAKILTEDVAGAELVAVCDIIGDKAYDFAEKYNSVGYGLDTKTEWQTKDVVRNERPDLITLATPSGLHYEHLIALSDYDIPVLVEKPMVLTLDDLSYIECGGGFGGWLCEVKQNRYNKAVQHLHKNLDRLGRIRFASVRVLWSRKPEYYQDWHGKWSMAGGVLANQAIHHIDLLWWLVGDVKRVSAFATYDDYTEVETGLVATLEFENGAIGTVEVTTLANKDLEGSLLLIGENGTVEIGGFAANKIETWNLNDNRFSDRMLASGGIAEVRENPPDVYGYGHIKLYEDVIDRLEIRKIILTADPDEDPPVGYPQPPVPLWQARKSLEIVHAIYEAVETGRVVELGGIYENSRLGR